MAEDAPSEADGWQRLFNGKDLTGWTANENQETFRVEDGCLVANGHRSHLYYTGDVNNGDFKDFDIWVEVMTKPKANSGIYFHTVWQEEGWPETGYEAQVNASHTDPRRTGGLYGIADVIDDAPHDDNEWVKYEVSVRGKRVVVRVNGQVTTDYTEPENPQREDQRFADRRLDHGAIALQGHDPGSEVRYRQVWVRVP